jgi:protein-tyrosine phosphatase
MFGLFKKKKEQEPLLEKADYSFLKTDMHSHLLPGIDDGSPDVESSIAYIKGMMEIGYKKFITTPHIYPDLYPNTRETITAAHQLLVQKLNEEQIDAEITAAAEYFIDDIFPDRLTNKEQLLTLQKNHVLVEISFLVPPPNLDQTIFNMIVNGYQPVLAHPERYSFYHHKKEVYHKFKDQGCMLQVNILSVAGYYGKSAQDIARYLLKEKLVDYIGTDLHHERHLAALANPQLSADIAAAMQTNSFLNSSL